MCGSTQEVLYAVRGQVTSDQKDGLGETKDGWRKVAPRWGPGAAWRTPRWEWERLEDDGAGLWSHLHRVRSEGPGQLAQEAESERALKGE